MVFYQKENYIFPSAKTKFLSCPSCKRNFQIKGRILVSPCVPLVLKCGHPICQSCIKRDKICKICNKELKYDTSDDEENKSFLINVYMIGLLNTIRDRPCIIDEPDMSFKQPFENKLLQKLSYGRCKECSFSATCSCLQCNIQYCNKCFSKIHRKFMTDHQKVDIPNTVDFTSSYCEEHGAEQEYFCDDCDIQTCPHCSLRYHATHVIVLQKDKNELLYDDFYVSQVAAAETLSRIDKSIKDLNEVKVEPANTEKVEVKISQHFTYLHGLLQIAEKKIMDKLNGQKQQIMDNIEDVKSQLSIYQMQIQDALMDAKTAELHLQKVNLNDIIAKLKNVSDLPCYLVKQSNAITECAKFSFDEKSVTDVILNHCNIELFETDSYHISRLEDVPAEYTLPELSVNEKIFSYLSDGLKFIKSSSSQMSSKYSGSGSVPSIKDEEESPPESTQQPAPPTESSDVYVEVLHIVNPSEFYVMEITRMEDFKMMQKQMQKLSYKRHKRLTEIDTCKTTMYMAQYGNEWCRARVLQTFTNANKETMYKLLFVDYGSKAEVTIDKIRKLPTQYQLIPPSIMQCGLFDIEPTNGSWSLAANQTMNHILREPGSTLIHVHSMQGAKFIVDLLKIHKDGNQIISIRDSLIFCECASWIRCEKLRRLNPHAVRKLFHEDLKVQNFTPVICSYIESPSVIYVQKAYPENQSFLTKLQCELNREYNDPENSKLIHVPEVGMLCAAPGTTRNNWCRGKITGTPGRKMVEVFMVDIGGKRKIRYDSIRRLHPQFMVAKTQAIKLQLKDVQPFPEEKEKEITAAYNYLVRNLARKELSVFVHELLEDGTYLSSVYIENNINYAHILASLDLIVYTGIDYHQSEMQQLPQVKAHSKKKKKKSATSLNHLESTSKDETELAIANGKLGNSSEADENSKKVVVPKKSQDSKDPFSVEVKIVKIESPDRIYVSDASRELEFQEMFNDMRNFYYKKDGIMEEGYKKDDVCVVYSSKDKGFMRAKIIEVLSESHVLVYIYDLAETEEILIEDLSPLHPKFAQLPAYAFRIKLAGILPSGGTKNWTSTACDKLSTLIYDNFNCKFYIAKIGNGDNDGDSISVELTMRKLHVDGPLLPTRIEMVSINRELINLGVAIPVKGFFNGSKSNGGQEKVLAIELQKELIMRQPSVPANYHKWNGINSKLNSDENDDDETDSNCDKQNCTMNIPFMSMNVPLPSENADWLPADVDDIKFDKFHASPTYVDFDCFVYLHPTERQSILNYIKMTLNNHYEKLQREDCDRNWREGEMCVVKFTTYDDEWYRGKVVKKINNELYEVLFVDYGNVEKLHVETLRKRVILSNIPVQAIKCQVHGLESVCQKWPISELDRIHAVLVDKDCIVSILERKQNMLIVSITLDNPVKDLIAHLCEDLELKVRTSHPTVPAESWSSSSDDEFNDSQSNNNSSDDNVNSNKGNNEDVIVDAIREISLNSITNDGNSCKDNLLNSTSEKNDKTENDNCLTYFWYKTIDLKNVWGAEMIEIEISSYLSAISYWAHLKENQHCPELKKLHNEYVSMMDEMQQIAKYQPVVQTAELGIPCCAKFTDGLWYRCVVIGHLDCNTVVVRFIDFGNEDYFDIKSLRHIDSRWLELPAMAYRFNLWKIKENYEKDDVNTSNFVKETLKTRFEDQSVFAKVKKINSDGIEVELYADISCTSLLYSSLIEMQLLTSQI